MSVLSDAAVSRGDLMREIAELKTRLDRVETARRMERTSARGQFRVFDNTGDVFRVSGEPGEIFMRDELAGPFIRRLLGVAVVFGSGFGTTNVTDDSDNPTPVVDIISGTQVSATAEIGESGRALTIMSGSLTASTEPGHTGRLSMYYHITGATDSESNVPSLAIGRAAAHASETVERPTATFSRVWVERSLNHGVSTFSLVADWSNPGNGFGEIRAPEIIVIPF